MADQATSARLGVAILGQAVLGVTDFPDTTTGPERFRWDGHCWQRVTDPRFDVVLVSDSDSPAVQEAQEAFAARLARILRLDVQNLYVSEKATINEAVIGRLWVDMFAARKISADQIAANAITAGKIAANSVTAPKIVASEELSAKVGTFLKVTTDMLVAGGAKITGELMASTITGINITGSTITGTTITGSVITGSTLQTATPGSGVNYAQIGVLPGVGNGLTVRGADGTRADVATTSGGPVMRMYDKGGKQRWVVDTDGTMTFTGKTTGVELRDDQGRLNLRLDSDSSTRDYNYGLRIFDSKGKSRASLTKSQDDGDQSYFSMYSPLNKRTIYAQSGGSDGDANWYPGLWICNKQGETRARLFGGSPTDPGGVATFNDGYVTNELEFDGDFSLGQGRIRGSKDGFLYLNDKGSNGRIRIYGLASQSGNGGDLAMQVSDQGNPYLVLKSSSRRFKTDIRPTTQDAEALLALEPVQYRSIGELEEWQSEHPDADDAETEAFRAALPWYTGLIAEDVAAVGLDQFLTHGIDGRISGLDYGRLLSLTIPLIRDLRDRVTTLEGAL